MTTLPLGNARNLIKNGGGNSRLGPIQTYQAYNSETQSKAGSSNLLERRGSSNPSNDGRVNTMGTPLKSMPYGISERHLAMKTIDPGLNRTRNPSMELTYDKNASPVQRVAKAQNQFNTVSNDNKRRVQQQLRDEYLAAIKRNNDMKLSDKRQNQ